MDSSFILLLNELTTYVKEMKSKYKLEKAQEFQKGYSIKQMQIDNGRIN